MRWRPSQPGGSRPWALMTLMASGDVKNVKNALAAPGSLAVAASAAGNAVYC